jgi:hypothetical protein
VTRTISYLGAVIENEALENYASESISHAIVYQELLALIVLLSLQLFILTLVWYSFLILRVVIEPLERIVYAMQRLSRADVLAAVRIKTEP